MTPQALRSPSRRILLTGLSTYWGGRLARHLEEVPGVEVIVGLDTRDPTVPLLRTEFVRVDTSYSALSRIVAATEVDTVLHTHLIVDSTSASARRVHEINVIGTMSLLAAATSSPSVRKVIVKSSTLVYGSDRRDPYYFREEHTRSSPATTQVEASLLEAEDYVRDFVRDSPHVVTTLLRFANVVGGDLETPLTRLLDAPMLPTVFGYDPRLQLVHTDDVVGALDFCVEHDVPGINNVAGDGIVPWSEVASRLRRPPLLLPPVGTGVVSAILRRAAIEIPPELQRLLRYGRGVDTSRLRAAGYRYRYTSAGALEAHVEEKRLKGTKGAEPVYRYEGELEEFLRRSPAVVRARR
jgi:UDP-glucose 4-epimerase